MDNKYIVIKIEDAERYLPRYDIFVLEHILRQIESGREKERKSLNEYAVINIDEPYFKEIKKIMKKYGHWEDKENPCFKEV